MLIAMKECRINVGMGRGIRPTAAMVRERIFGVTPQRHLVQASRFRVPRPTVRQSDEDPSDAEHHQEDGNPDDGPAPFVEYQHADPCR